MALTIDFWHFSSGNAILCHTAMDAITRTLIMWEQEAIIIMVVLCAVVLFHYATKLWSAPADAVLACILGTAIGVATAVLFLTRHIWGVALGPRACWFIALYLWCVMVMVFFAARNTPRFKLFLGLASQAGILYALFILL